jgi:hypothetical protein
MTLCSDDHDEICFEGRECPLCAVISDNNDLIAANKDLKEEIDTHECKEPK